MVNHVFSHLSEAAFKIPLHQSSVTAWQGHIPFAFWCLDQWRPKIFVELGTHLGDSYFAFCQAAKENATGTQCYAVDSWQGDAHTGPYDSTIYEHVQQHNQQHYQDFSHLLRMNFDSAIEKFADRSIDLLHIDGLHTYEAVAHDFNTWLPKMSERGIILFHDSNVYEKDFGVWQLMREIETSYPHFHFYHSFGLSIFFVGENLPETARWLQEISAHDGDQWRMIFSHLGGCVVQRAEAFFQQMHFQQELQKQGSIKQNLATAPTNPA